MFNSFFTAFQAFFSSFYYSSLLSAFCAEPPDKLAEVSDIM